MLEKVTWREETLLPRRIIFEPVSEKTFQPAPQDLSFLHWKSRTSFPHGLKNVGNTCFLNSTLQCLLHTPPVHNFPHTCSKVFCVLCSIKSLFNTHSSVPEAFLTSVPRLSRQFQIGRQADAHELLRFLIDKIEPKEFKSQVFSGELQSTVRCKECRYESIVNEIFLDLSLEVSSNSLEKCLNDFCREEVLTGDNKYNCPNCKKKTNATKQYLIKSCPSVLTIQLKRFTNAGKKDNRTVGFREKLSLEKELLCGEKVDYVLYAVLIHVGFGCRSGHYYSFVKSANEMWYEVNDSSVSQVSVSRVLGHNGAYILLYKRDVPKVKVENCVVDNRNQVEVQVEFPQKSFVHPTKFDPPVKKFKHSSQDFPNYWGGGNFSLGYVKDRYDKNLDKGKNKKKKKAKKRIGSNQWDRVVAR